MKAHGVSRVERLILYSLLVYKWKIWSDCGTMTDVIQKHGDTPSGNHEWPQQISWMNAQTNQLSLGPTATVEACDSVLCR